MIRPTLVATFILDDNGTPKVAHRGKVIHYCIRLTVDNVPDDTYAVTYELHESYYEPVRESRRRSDKFSEEITSYGDFEIRATIRGRRRHQTIISELSKALQRGHGKGPSPVISGAISSITKH